MSNERLKEQYLLKWVELPEEDLIDLNKEVRDPKHWSSQTDIKEQIQTYCKRIDRLKKDVSHLHEESVVYLNELRYYHILLTTLMERFPHDSTTRHVIDMFLGCDKSLEALRDRLEHVVNESRPSVLLSSDWKTK